MAYISCRTCKHSYYSGTPNSIRYSCKDTKGLYCIDREYQYYEPKDKINMEWPLPEFLTEGEMIV